MCLILFAYNTHPEYKLILAANRDEFYKRPTRQAHWHGTNPDILSGIDKYAGGTWMGISENGRLAALTNYRNPADMQPHRASRGKLVYDFLKSSLNATSYSGVLTETAKQYNGYNLIFGNVDNLCYYSNKIGDVLELNAGIYGLSNHLLDTPWPKVTNGKRKLRSVINREFSTENLLSMMHDETIAPDDQLPSTGVSSEKEKMLSPMFIRSVEYGTRCTSVILVDRSGAVTFTERSFNSENTSDITFRFRL